MYWTLELASYLEDAPWPATKDELIDYAIRSGAPIEVRTYRNLRMRVNFMKGLKTSGVTTRHMTTFILMRTNIETNR